MLCSLARIAKQGYRAELPDSHVLFLFLFLREVLNLECLRKSLTLKNAAINLL